MDFDGSKWENKYNLNKPTFYLRYARMYLDDILAAFDKEQDFCEIF